MAAPARAGMRGARPAGRETGGGVGGGGGDREREGGINAHRAARPLHPLRGLPAEAETPALRRAPSSSLRGRPRPRPFGPEQNFPHAAGLQPDPAVAASVEAAGAGLAFQPPMRWPLPRLGLREHGSSGGGGTWRADWRFIASLARWLRGWPGDGGGMSSVPRRSSEPASSFSFPAPEGPSQPGVTAHCTRSPSPPCAHTSQSPSSRTKRRRLGGHNFNREEGGGEDNAPRAKPRPPPLLHPQNRVTVAPSGSGSDRRI